MRLLILLAIAVRLAAQPTIGNVVIDNITSHGARATWTTTTGSMTSNRIRIGTSTGVYTTSWTPENTDFGSTDHGWFFNGLSPATNYFAVVCSTNGGGETCSSEQTFRTLMAESGNITVATLPTAVADLTPPTSFTTTYSVAADCSDLQSQLNTAAAQDGNNNYRVLIPASTVCGGRYSLPAKSGVNPNGTGWLVLTTDTTLPPVGTRVESTMIGNLARIVSNLIGVEYYQTTQPGSCTVGQVWVDSDSTTSSAYLYYCTATNTWTAQTPAGSGTSAPGTCTQGDFWWDSDEADQHQRLFLCQETNKPIRTYMEANANYEPYAALYGATSAKRWAVVGLRIERPRISTTYTDLLPTASGNGYEYFATNRCAIYTVPTNDRIIWDRLWIDGIGHPHRTLDSYCFAEGTNLVVRDSYFNEWNRWIPAGGFEWTPNTIFFRASGGPVLIQNNYFKNCHGITIFHSDDSAAGQVNDVTIKRNTFYEDPSHNRSIGSWGWWRRHMTEGKRGQRWLIEGNVYDGGWPANNQGATIGITPRPGGAPSRTNTNILADWTIQFNQFLFTPQAFIIAGHNDYSNHQILGATRLTIQNNLVYTTGESRTAATTGWPNGSSFAGQIANVGLGIENMSIRHNSFLNIKSPAGAANMLSHAWNQYNARLELSDNTYSVASSATTNYGVMIGGAYFGTDALQREWKSGDSAYSYTMAGNAMKYASGDANPYPSGNYRTTTLTDITNALYQNTLLGDEAAWRPKWNGILASSTARGSDGVESGVDWDGLDSAIGNARNLRVLSITSSAANVHYTAPDTTACTVEYGTSSSVFTGSRTTDTPAGSRFRTVALSGLTGGTTYYVRVYCARMLSTSFATL